MQTNKRNSCGIRQTREEIKNRFDTIDSILGKLGFEVYNGKITPILEFAPFHRGIFAISLLIFAITKLFEWQSLIWIAVLFAYFSIQGVIEKFCFQLKTRAWKPKLAELEVEIEHLRRSYFGNYADYFFDENRLDETISELLQLQSMGGDPSVKFKIDPDTYVQISDQEIDDPVNHLAYLECWINVEKNLVFAVLKVFCGDYHEGGIFGLFPRFEKSLELVRPIESKRFPKLKNMIKKPASQSCEKVAS